ncbi:TPM domain-containing protein [Mucilaginibacter ginsenosidivorans]|uniref:TPM domain-containing protein n=1 Tax=Mucilaginibacter ginsenosidivorans TaxID=398053 RepID=A0A5B8UUF8_9SPHI|nr:TPM domain-containing protein [Mucilaginibacter ginsenosidivorans]QEC62056.1 TPM domain-containing protein [Mucilaginibacter ginsenosidivorans]
MKKVILFCLILLPFFLKAQNMPRPPSYIGDYTNTLSDTAKIKLTARLKALDIPHNGRIDVIIIKTVGNSDILTFGRKLLLSWSEGNKDTDNDLLVLIAMDDGKAAVITGITIQKTVTNAICRNIIKHDITPHFKNGEYYEGLDETATDLVKAVKKEYKLAQVK